MICRCEMVALHTKRNHNICQKPIVYTNIPPTAGRIYVCLPYPVIRPVYNSQTSNCNDGITLFTILSGGRPVWSSCCLRRREKGLQVAVGICRWRRRGSTAQTPTLAAADGTHFRSRRDVKLMISRCQGMRFTAAINTWASVPTVRYPHSDWVHAAYRQLCASADSEQPLDLQSLNPSQLCSMFYALHLIKPSCMSIP